MSSLLEQVEETQHSETPVPTQDVHEYYVKNHAPTTPIHTPDDHEQYVEKHGPTLDRVIDKIKIGICVHVGTYAYEDWYRLSYRAWFRKQWKNIAMLVYMVLLRLDMRGSGVVVTLPRLFLLGLFGLGCRIVLSLFL